MNRLTRYHQEGLLVNEGGYYELDNSNYTIIVAKLGKLEDLEDKLGCPLDILLKALENDTIKYKDWICEGISLYYNGAGKWCFATSYQDKYGQTKYIDEIDVATYGIDWWLVE